MDRQQGIPTSRVGKMFNVCVRVVKSVGLSDGQVLYANTSDFVEI